MTVCDFCSHPDVRWAFPARDFVHERELRATGLTESGNVVHQDVDLRAGSSGGWAACQACYSMIRRGDRDGLVRRSAKLMQRKPEGSLIPLNNLIALIRPLQDQFWTNREGDPVPVTPGDQEDPTR
jgi:hypothetical protein